MVNKIVNNMHVSRQIFFIGGDDILSGHLDNLLYKVFDSFGDRETKLLYLPIALFNNQKKVVSMFDYIKKLEKYLQNLHKKVKFSWINSDVSDSKISKEIALADVVFISGGDTEYLIKRLSKKSINESLIEAYKKGVVIIGNSAGALALAEVGVSLNNCMFKKYQGIALIDKYIPVVHFCDDPNSGFNEFKRSHSNKEFVYLKENESCVIVNNQKLVKLN